MEFPQTVSKCDGCGDELNVLNPHLYMMLKARREKLVITETESEDPNEVPEAEMYLGVISGRGVIKRFHGFKCLSLWANDDKRKGKDAKLEYHAEKAVA